jgi:hypothetical protein
MTSHGDSPGIMFTSLNFLSKDFDWPLTRILMPNGSTSFSTIDLSE